MSLYNDYYTGFLKIKAACSHLENPADGSTFFGVRTTHFDDVDQTGTVYQTVYKFKREINPFNKRYYANFRLKKDGNVYKNSSDYGWVFFQTKSDADNFISTLKTFAQECIKNKIKLLEEQIEALN